MSELNDLINKLCPDGVPYKKLGDIVDILDSKRKPVKRGSRVSGKYPYYGANGVQDYINDYLFDGEFLLVGEDGSVITDKGTPILNWANGKIWVNNHAHVLQEKANKQYMLRYIKYALECKNIAMLIHGAIPKLNQQTLKSIEIPVPPLPVQSEIVRILDAFTELEAELEAELADRIEQYEYYRDYLLDKKNLEAMDGKPVEMKPMWAITTWDKKFNGVDKKQQPAINRHHYYLAKELEPLIVPNGDIKVLTTSPSDSYTTVELAKDNIKDGEIVAIPWGGNAIVQYYNGKYITSDNRIAIVNDEKQLNCKFLFYVLKNREKELAKYYRGAGIKHPDMFKVLHMEIPVPSLATQERIVDILDRFDTLTTSLTDGIPAEIAMRREQYEYFRSRLLDFPRLPDDSDSDGE